MRKAQPLPKQSTIVAADPSSAIYMNVLSLPHNEHRQTAILKALWKVYTMSIRSEPILNGSSTTLRKNSRNGPIEYSPTWRSARGS